MTAIVCGLQITEAEADFLEAGIWRYFVMTEQSGQQSLSFNLTTVSMSDTYMGLSLMFLSREHTVVLARL